MNTKRGEYELKLRDGQVITLCLTLGAMVEIEESLGIEDFTKIGEHLSKPKMSDLAKMMVALAHGGGHEEVGEREILNAPINLSDLQKIIEGVFADELGGEDEENPTERGRPAPHLETLTEFNEDGGEVPAESEPERLGRSG